ncbi:hypothetical protein FACS18948_3390 [Clostridia bacterium]|nr:hypothetical protein FACS18948_3390 [Clostridia bacterium]
MNKPIILTSASNGKLYVNYPLEPGVYYLTQLTTAEGYVFHDGQAEDYYGFKLVVGSNGETQLYYNDGEDTEVTGKNIENWIPLP